MRTLPAYLAFWLVLMVLAIANGVLRERFFAPLVAELQAHQISTVIFIALTGTAVWLLAKVWRSPASAREAVAIGVCWLVFTIVFEFSFGRFVVGNSWQRLLHDYNLLAGRIWPVFLFWLTVLPYVVFRFRGDTA